MGDCKELRASRARVAEAALADRRRFERALHDSVQQDLIAFSVELQLILEQIDEAGTARTRVEALKGEVHSALARVRALADEIYPSVLDAQGLVGSSRRYPRELEAAVALCSRGAETAIGDDHGQLVVELRGLADPTGARDLLAAVGATVTAEPNLLRATFSV